VPSRPTLPLPVGWRSTTKKQLPIIVVALAALLVPALAATAAAKPSGGPIETTVSASYNQITLGAAGRKGKSVKTSVDATFNPGKSKVKVSLSVKKKPQQCLFGREVILVSENGTEVADALSGSKPTTFDASKLEKGDYTVDVREKKVQKVLCRAGAASVLIF